MYTHTSSYFEQRIVTIHPGEYYASNEDIIIATVLGSCVSVAFWDQRLKQGGINHFMLPGDLDDEDMIKSCNAKYGMFAIELLYNELLKAGSRKADIIAKVFGGASVLRLGSGPTKIPRDNVNFALAFLNKENISIVANDTGGILPRKIFFFAQTGKVLLKRISGALSTVAEREEAVYLDKIQREDTGNFILFDR